MLKFADYTTQLVYGLESYMEMHSDATPDSISRWCEAYDWLDAIYTPIYEAHQDIVNATTVEDLLLAVQWASHLNHASGHIFEYCSDYEEMSTTLDHLEQKGLDATFKWKRAAKKLLGNFGVNYGIMSPQDIEELIFPKCVYCGDVVPKDKNGKPMSPTCEKCQEVIDLVGLCINCEHGIGHYGELCYDCMVEHTGGFDE